MELIPNHMHNPSILINYTTFKALKEKDGKVSGSGEDAIIILNALMTLIRVVSH